MLEQPTLQRNWEPTFSVGGVVLGQWGCQCDIPGGMSANVSAQTLYSVDVQLNEARQFVLQAILDGLGNMSEMGQASWFVLFSPLEGGESVAGAQSAGDRTLTADFVARVHLESLEAFLLAEAVADFSFGLNKGRMRCD